MREATGRLSNEAWTLYRRTLAALLAVVVSGCSLTRYNVQLNAFTAPKAQSLVPGKATVGVVASPSTSNVLFAQEVQGKVETLLRAKGFEVVPPAQADVLVFALFGMGRPTAQIQTLPLYTPGGTTVSQQGRVTVVGQEKGSWTFFSQAHTEQTRWLLLAAADAAAFHRQLGPGDTVQWLWIADVLSAGRSADLRRVIDYMLVPTVDWFGRSTGGIVSVRVGQDDARVVKLRASGGS